MSAVEIVQIYLAGLQVIATVLIALVLFRQAEKLKRIETTGHVQASYNVLNSIALENPENLKILDSFGRPDTNDTEETRRKRWCAFVWLVALQEVHFSVTSRLLDRRYGEQSLRQQLEIILKDDLVYWLVRNRGFDPGYVDRCTRIRTGVEPNKPLVYSEEDAIKGLTTTLD